MSVLARATDRLVLVLVLALTVAVVSGVVFCPAALGAEPRAAWKTSKLRGSPTPPEPYRVRPAFPKLRFKLPSSLVQLPGENRMLVTEIGGRILTFRPSPDVESADLAGDLTALVSGGQNRDDVRLFSATLHPKFAENRHVYVCYTHPQGKRHTRVSRFVLDKQSPPKLKLDSEQIIITWPAGGHNGGCLGFGKDGYLYISTGDGWGPNPPDNRNTGQDISDLLGAILRIDVERGADDRRYAIPKDNPFVDHDGARPEIWSYGLRNPWKFGIDRSTGAMYVADNGWESWEMVHRVVRGGNCGWPIREGRAVLRSEIKPGPTPIRPPVKDHPHSEANSVIGGPVYRGGKLGGLDGTFVYGDYITGTIWGLKEEGASGYQHQTLVDTDLRIVAFGEGREGQLYVVDYDYTGQIYELLKSDQPDTSAEFPRLLSETGLFASLDRLTPAAGVMPYRPRVSRWLDGAVGRRWIAIPGSGSVRLGTGKERPAEYPEGTVLIKHLELPRGRARLRIETQILHYEGGRWRPYSYLWDEDSKDARLVDSIGTQRTIVDEDANRPRQHTWRVGATNECRLCHNAGSGFVLGFVPEQLDFSLAAATDESGSQLAELVAHGVIAERPADASGFKLVDPRDPQQTLDDRARSYLHVNCSMCHHPGGNAIVSFYLRRDLPFGELKTGKGTGIGTFGMRDAKLIVPGDPYRSVLFYRMSKLGYARMPYIGSQVVDGRGVALIDEWIRAMPTSGKLSAPLNDGTPEHKALARLAVPEEGTRKQRDAAIGTLLGSTEGTLALVARMHGRKLARSDYRAAVRLGAAARSDVSGLMETFVPEAQRRARLGPRVNPEVVLGRAGDAARGKLIYFSDSARCRACHEVHDKQQSVGPTLADIAKKYPRRSEMLQHILQPSLKIDDPFGTYTVITDAGKVITGLLVKRTPNDVVLKTATRKIVRIPLKDVDALRKSKTSLMPERILSDLTAQEAADLLAFILSVAAAEK